MQCILPIKSGVNNNIYLATHWNCLDDWIILSFIMFDIFDMAQKLIFVVAPKSLPYVGLWRRKDRSSIFVLSWGIRTVVNGLRLTCRRHYVAGYIPGWLLYCYAAIFVTPRDTIKMVVWLRTVGACWNNSRQVLQKPLSLLLHTDIYTAMYNDRGCLYKGKF
jgi:hypothetical protein